MKNISGSCKKGRVELVSSHQLNNIFKKSMISRWLKYLSLVVLLFSAATALVIAKDRGTSKRLTTDQLINSLRSIKNPSLQHVESGEPAQDVKCGFGIRASVHNRWQEFTGLQKAEIINLLQVESFEKDTVIGRFHIFYDVSVDSVNTPALLASDNSRIPNTAKQYVDSVGRIFNDVYHIEVEQLGYDPPPFESGETSYRVFIVNMSDYGYTDWDVSPLNPGNSAPRYPCFVHIHNDFSPFYTKGMNALKVTAAHEFHHVIQVGSYGFWANAVYAHELTSVWFEDVNYTDVNDYYQYLTDYFVGFSDGRSFNYDPYEGGYERCVWAHFIAKQFSINMMRKIWEEMRTKTYQENTDVFLESNDAIITDSGMTLQTAFAEFTKWNYYTADRADTVKYYPEGNHYPRFQPLQTIPFNTTTTTNGNVEPLSTSMYEFDMQQDTITAVIANVDVNSAINRNTTQQQIDITLSSGLQTNISAENLSLWSSFFIESSTRTDIPHLQSNAAPNPFRLAEAPWLKLPINQDAAKTAEVFFFTSSLQLVYSGFLSVNDEDGFRAIVVPASEVKSKLSSGIYFILAKTANSDYKWKVAVIR